MNTLDPTQACFLLDDDLLNFNLEGEGEGEQVPETIFKGDSALQASTMPAAAGHETRNGSFPEVVEEELEWLSNKDAFPAVETCLGILSDNPELVLNHHSPVSVLDNSSGSSGSSKTNSHGTTVASCCGSIKIPISYPVRARSKRIRKRRACFGNIRSQQQRLLLNQANLRSKQESSRHFLPPSRAIRTSGASLGRRCLHCQADKTPQWRAGPMGPKTLCNACGVRYKSGRLLPEYRPASSPTFSSTLHSNSHRKVVDMRRQKQLVMGGGGGGGVVANKACGVDTG